MGKLAKLASLAFYVVATPDDAAVMNAYAATKIICSDDKRLPLYTLVNFACDEQGARSVHERLSQACRRFLGFDLMPAGHVPASDEVRQAARARQPFVLASPHCAAAVEIEAVAQQLIAVRSEPKAPHMLEHRWQQALVSEQVVGMRS